MSEIKPQSHLIHENDVLIKDHNIWLHFSNPHQIIAATRLEEVLPALAEIERSCVEKNWYAAGFLSYESAPAFDPALRTRLSDGFPYLWFGLYSEPHSIALPTLPRSRPVLDWQPTVDRETYEESIAKIKDAISHGKTYQVNYTMRMKTDFAVNAWDYFLSLMHGQSNYAAHIDTGQYTICSASPELFFHLDGKRITCRPMKGTVPRGRTTPEDDLQSSWLKHSEKNRAENVMIVDMIRNDLGKIAEIGSVRVPSLFEVERYPTLWQMTSTVTASTHASLTEILTALFPCASITGAPKVSTMNTIADLENTPRNIYTGTIGFFSPHRKARFSVAIRTLLLDRQQEKAEYGIGGGIIWDSCGSEEYVEALLKARILLHQTPDFSLLETMSWTPKEGFFLRRQHIARLLDSADYFDVPVTKQKLEDYLSEIASEFLAPQRVRLLLDRTGNLRSEAMSLTLESDNQVLKICLAREPVDSHDVFLFHKTTHRNVYETARQGMEEFDDVLLYNKQRELTEFTIGNLVVEIGGQLFTPPISAGVLPGTFRAHLIETGQVAERSIPMEELAVCTRIFRVSSIRRWQRVQIQEAPGTSMA